MLKVKIFEAEHEEELEDEINHFLESQNITSRKEVEIQYRSALGGEEDEEGYVTSVYSFSAMIIYEA